RIVEIGSGFSTLISSIAIGKNKAEDPSYRCELTAIEPFPQKQLIESAQNLTRLIESPVQKVELSEFDGLERNDILFIDSSHVSKIGSDVNYEVLEILPRLQSGVVIHIHDVFIP